jgi:predicted acylesterase/phospholipase RssA/CRP-like cAMP-binding protein
VQIDGSAARLPLNCTRDLRWCIQDNRKTTMQSLPKLLGDEGWEQLQRSMHARTFQPGEPLVAQGDLAPDFHVIVEGTVSVVAATTHGDEHELGRLRAGDCIGEMSLLTGDPASAQVVAVSATTTWSASQLDIEQMGEMRGRLIAALSSILAERLRHANERILSRHSTNIIAICADSGDLAALAGLPAAVARVTGEQTALVAAGDAQFDAARLLTPDGAVSVHSTDGHPVADVVDRLAAGHPQVVVLLDEASAPLAGANIFHVLRAGPGRVDASMHTPGGNLILICDDPWTVPSLAALSSRASRTVAAIVGGDGRADFDRVARVLTRRTVGIAFGAGAAKGFAHLGVLRAFKERGVPIDAVSGASIGAAVAAGVAAGTSIDDLEQLVKRVAARIVRPAVPVHSLLSNAGVKEELQRAAGDARIEDLNLPLAIVAVDLFRRAEVTFTSGLVWPRILASTAIPGVYPPVAALGSFLVDGGILTPVPARQCRDLGADIVIGVRLTATRTSPREQLDRKPGKPLAVESMIRAFEIMQNRISEISHEPSDITIEISVEGTGGLRDFKRGSEIARAGYDAAREAAGALAARLPYTEGAA